ncbi:MAG: FMN-dependent NADH-azoreductase [Betaproteobacteria bacterium RIFCSPLOWO2_12_FULL_63_13]|nr:MAG: FMN-dependent NADH-azoreductase [Betaproteobacteria bacterium RIFCSPLOWO2_12_FULL_63_13]
MKTILQINASLFTEDGQSSRLADQLVAELRRQYPGAEVIVRDLARAPVPHLDAARFGAFLATLESRTPAQQAVLNYSDELIDELRRADVIVLGLPMYNFGVPSQLKAWIDHVARAGITFKYTEKGAVGLLAGKKVYVLATRGGRYAGTSGDYQTPYVRQFFAFLGITDVEFIYAEGLAMGETAKNEALAAAQSVIHGLAGRQRVAA